MIMLNIHEAKTHLSKHIENLLQKGTKIVLCRRNQPVAEIVALKSKVQAKRRFETASDLVSVSEEFFTPLPDELREHFE